ncbi:unnamed protein product [Gadus morhua 'NCC']
MCATTEIESEEEKEEREKRKTKQNPLYMDSDSDEPSGELKKPRLSRPPDVRVPAAWSSQLARNKTMAASASGAGPYHQLQVPQRGRLCIGLLTTVRGYALSVTSHRCIASIPVKGRRR